MIFRRRNARAGRCYGPSFTLRTRQHRRFQIITDIAGDIIRNTNAVDMSASWLSSARKSAPLLHLTESNTPPGTSIVSSVASVPGHGHGHACARLLVVRPPKSNSAISIFLWFANDFALPAAVCPKIHRVGRVDPCNLVRANFVSELSAKCHVQVESEVCIFRL